MKIGIVNEAQMAQVILKHAVESEKRHVVIWVAENGKAALEKAGQNQPDVILMDIAMPGMDGVIATKKIMEACPCAILIVTSQVSENIDKIFEAMWFGALDVVKTPSFGFNSSKEVKELLGKLEMIASFLGEKKAATRKKNMQKSSLSAGDVADLVVLGASTGGPMALIDVLETYPRPPPFATVIIQHFDEQYLQAFARFMEEQTSLAMLLIEEGDKLVNGNVYIAKRNAHLLIDSCGRFSYSLEPKGFSYRPSINLFLSSLAERWPKKALAVILTGMGDDGALGLKELKEKGWLTIAQEEESCIVFGMPKAAIRLEAAQFVLTPKMIGKMVVNHFLRR